MTSVPPPTNAQTSQASWVGIKPSVEEGSTNLRSSLDESINQWELRERFLKS